MATLDVLIPHCEDADGLAAALGSVAPQTWSGAMRGVIVGGTIADPTHSRPLCHSNASDGGGKGARVHTCFRLMPETHRHAMVPHGAPFLRMRCRDAALHGARLALHGRGWPRLVSPTARSVRAHPRLGLRKLVTGTPVP